VPNQIASFIRLEHGEAIGREFYVVHSSTKRFSVGAIVAIIFGCVLYLVPGIILAFYFRLRRIKVTHGYACITNKRIIYYEFNDHPQENFHSLNTVHLKDLSTIQFKIEQTLFAKSFDMKLSTSKAGLVVGAVGAKGIFKYLNNNVQLEPGPDALEFVQIMSGEIAARKRIPT